MKPALLHIPMFAMYNGTIVATDATNPVLTKLVSDENVTSMLDPDDVYAVDTLGPAPDKLPSSVLAVVVPSYSDTTSTPLCVLKLDPGNTT